MRGINQVGKQFGRLVVQELSGRSKSRHLIWSCICDCGNTLLVSSERLNTGRTQSCGCLQKDRTSEACTIHGQAIHGQVSKEYKCWQDMLKRCYNPKHKYYVRYGGRGIRVCERWLHSFENFYEDMGRCPKDRSLDRKDNDGDYCKENCRWATKEEQMNNTDRNVWKEYKGERKTLSQWARSLGLNKDTLRSRLCIYNWSIEKALTAPVRGQKMTRKPLPIEK